MSHLPDVIIYPSWQPQYLSAVRKLDPEKLKVKIATVKEALFRRGMELKTTGDNSERMAMRDAACQLRTLMVSVLRYPTWTTTL
jgi:hypothetical protein